MKYHLTGFGISALLHISVLLASMPLLLWQDRLGQVEEPQSVQLSLAQFVPALPPEPVAAPPPVAEPVPEPERVQELPKPEPKPAEKPKPKPKAEKKPLEKAKSKKQPSQPTHQHEPVPEPQPQVQAAAPAVSRPTPTTQQAAPPVLSAGSKSAEAAYKTRLENLIASRKQYPHKAEESGVEGKVMVSFTVFPNGSITGIRVSKSSGNTWLDKAALQAVTAVSGALPFPPEIRKAQWDFGLTVNFSLDW